jgi:hypothetical protein
MASPFEKSDEIPKSVKMGNFVTKYLPKKGSDLRR